jgi:hypothetical protein
MRVVANLYSSAKTTHWRKVAETTNDAIMLDDSCGVYDGSTPDLRTDVNYSSGQNLGAGSDGGRRRNKSRSMNDGERRESAIQNRFPKTRSQR